MAPQQHASIAIIGGGVLGVSLLYHLAKAGVRDCVLLEKNELTAGSTWHAAGLCTHFAHDLTIMAMRAHSVRLYRDELPAEVGHPVGFHACGALRITRSAQRLREFRHVRGLSAFAGHEFRIVTPGEIRALHPLAIGDGLLGGVYEPHDGHVDPAQAVQAMALVARRHGAVIHRHCPVTAMRVSQGGQWQLSTPRGELTADTVVNAAGTWCRDVGQMMGVDLPVVPILHQYLVTEVVPEVAAHTKNHGELPIIRDPEESWYVRQEGDGLLIGPYEQDAMPWAVDGVPARFGMELLPPDVERVTPIVELAMHRLPVLQRAGIKRVVNGPITFTPDGNALIGPAFGVPQAWIMSGSSMGLMEGGGAGWFLAKWLADGASPLDATSVDPRRFGDYADRDYRVARARESFARQFAIHFPAEELPAGRPQRLSALHDNLLAHGAVMGCVNGWERANYFADSDGAVSFAEAAAAARYARGLRSLCGDGAVSFAEAAADSRAMGAVPSPRASPGASPPPTARYGQPDWHEQVAAEALHVHRHASLADLSAFSKFAVSGPDADALLATLGAERAPQHTGGIRIIHALSTTGGILSEFVVTKLGTNRYYLTSAAAAERCDEELLRVRGPGRGWDVTVRNVTTVAGVLAIMGPQARAVLERVAGHRLQGAWMHAKHVRFDALGCEALALRMSFIGEPGWELHLAMPDMPAVYQALCEAGAALGVRLGHFGAYAINAMRLEKGFAAWGAELTSERTVVEAGLVSAQQLNAHNFIGKEATLARAGAGSEGGAEGGAEADAWRLVLLQLQCEGTDVYPFGGHLVRRGSGGDSESCIVGIVTSAAYGARCGKFLALAWLREPSVVAEVATASEAGKANGVLRVNVYGNECAARILPRAPFDAEHWRMRDA